ncbi:MAG: hypothetical protein CTY19_01660 [Methylomonas sp.]|nr:MAG: hypothetical protein CTY19_01660 [Methylomonas sp.]
MLPLLDWAWADDELSVVLPECTASLQRPTVEAHVLIVRSGCPLSLQSLSTLLDRGFQRFLSDHLMPFHGIYLGRLMEYPEWSEDLAKAAAKSATWNSKRGRPSTLNESNNQRVRLLLNGSAYPHHLQTLFANYQLRACVSDVEKVLVYKAKDIFPDKTTLPKGISAKARLPVDAQIWLKLQPLSTPCADQ